MLTRTTILGAVLLCAVFASADEPERLVELRQQFESLRSPTEADRVRYITDLVRLRESFSRAEYKKTEAIDSEIIRHPMPANVDSTELRKRLIGEWNSARHNYSYRGDGTWTMLPEFEDGIQATHGGWHIEANKFFQNAVQPGEPPDKGETMIILTDTDFVWSTHLAPYYMRRGDVYPWR